MTQCYPKLDRSDFHPNFKKIEQNDAVDIGWSEGVLSDGRACRAECWAIDQVTMLTFFSSDKNIETASTVGLNNLLIKEGLIEFLTDKNVTAVRKFNDPVGNTLWCP